MNCECVLCVCDVCVCVTMLCAKELCVTMLCVKELCVTMLCLKCVWKELRAKEMCRSFVILCEL